MPALSAAGRRRPLGNRVISLIFQFLEERGRDSGGGRFGVVKGHGATRLGRSAAPMTKCSSRSGVIGFQSLARRSAPNTTMRRADARGRCIDRKHALGAECVGQGTAAACSAQQTTINNARISMGVRQIEFSRARRLPAATLARIRSACPDGVILVKILAKHLPLYGAERRNSAAAFFHLFNATKPPMLEKTT
jgi:hypothetical protein